MTIADLMDAVVNECYCSWGVFMENANNAGFGKRQLAQAVSECETKRDLMKLVNQFI